MMALRWRDTGTFVSEVGTSVHSLRPFVTLMMHVIQHRRGSLQLTDLRLLSFSSGCDLLTSVDFLFSSSMLGISFEMMTP